MDLSASAVMQNPQLLGPPMQAAAALLRDALLAVVGLGGMLVGGLRTVDKTNAMEHPQRRRLNEWILAEPGIHLRELASRLGTAVTNTQWHLRKLEAAGHVRTEKAHGRRLYYPTQGGVGARGKVVRHAAVRNDNAERILQFIAAHPGLQNMAVSEGLAMNPGTVRWHLRRLEEANLVRTIPDGLASHYFANLHDHPMPPQERSGTVPGALTSTPPRAPAGVSSPATAAIRPE